MATFGIVNDAVIHQSELLERGVEIADHLVSRAAGRAREPLELGSGRSLSLSFTPRGPLTGAGEMLPFKKIGKGLPLHVLIDRVYTGRHPSRGLLNRGSDIAVLSGVKDYSVFLASARALNLMAEKVQSHSQLSGSAFHKGTPLVLYSPAVMADRLILSAEIAVDSFDKDLFDVVARGFAAAAGIPLMLPYSGFILVGGEMVKLVGGLADALFDGQPAFSITESLNFGLPGRLLAIADHWLLTHRTDLSGYHYDPAQGLLDPNGQIYDDDDPYILLTLDGTERPELNGFAANAASAAVMERFLRMKDRAAASVDAIVEGLQLVSDMRLRQQAEQLKTQINAATDPELKKKVADNRAAILKNIGNDVLRPA